MMIVSKVKLESKESTENEMSLMIIRMSFCVIFVRKSSLLKAISIGMFVLIKPQEKEVESLKIITRSQQTMTHPFIVRYVSNFSQQKTVSKST